MKSFIYQSCTTVCFLLMYVSVALAQPESPIKQQLIKVNVPALVFKNISFQYERQTTKRHSIALGLRFRPAGSLPVQGWIENMVDDPKIKVGLAKIGNVGFMPEYRFYLSKRKASLQGFYFGAFAGINYYYGNVPVNYSDYVNSASVNKTAVFDGHTYAFTAGVQLGAQWRLSNKWSLDWWILGPNFGVNTGDFTFNGALNDIERISLQFELEKIQQTIPFISVTPSKPTATGAAFKVGGPWAGIRAMGLNIGYHF